MLITAVLLSKLAHHTAPHKISISEMLFWLKNNASKAKCAALYSWLVGNRTVGRSEVAEQNSRKLRATTNFTLFC